MRGGNKFGARRIAIDGIMFDSQMEANYYRQLKLLQHAGEVTNIELQPIFILQDAKVRPDGVKLQPIKYKADFRVTYRDGHIEIVDVKGHKTKDYQLKKKMFLHKFENLTIKEVMV